MRLARRAAFDLRPNALAALLEGKRAASSLLLDLTESNPTRAELPYPADEILVAFADPRWLRYEPSPRGQAPAREAVAAYYAERGQMVDPARILLTASTSEAYSFLFKLLCDPGDEVLVPAPSYPLFEFLAALEAVQVRPYPLVYHDGWHVDLTALVEAAGARARAIVLVHPNNPTGSFLKRGELEGLRRVCTERQLALVSDEVFGDYAFGEDPERAPSLAGERQALAFTLSGLSKVVGLPQVKLGWVVASGPGADAALERLEVIADTYLSVSAQAQVAAPALLALRDGVGGAIRNRIGENRAWLAAALGSSSCTLLRLEGGWYATVRLPHTRTEEEWVLGLLAEHDVYVHPGHFFDFPEEAYVVVSLLTKPQTFREGVARLLAFVSAGDRS